MKRISDSGEAVVLIPLVLEPVEIEFALTIPLVEIRDIPVTVRVLPR